MITTALTDAFRLAVLNGVHQPDHSYWMALYTERASLGAHTTSYQRDGECVGEGYEAGGLELDTPIVQMIDGVACMDWAPPTWPVVTVEAAGFLIYNRSVKGLPAVLTFAFDQVYRATNGPFTPLMPPPGSQSSLVQWPGVPELPMTAEVGNVG